MADEKPKPGKFDTIEKGSQDMWPALRTPPAKLAAEILAGKHDGCLSELGELAAVHLHSDQVLEAVRARKG
jgi:hypothetical protein